MDIGPKHEMQIWVSQESLAERRRKMKKVTDEHSSFLNLQNRKVHF